MRAVAACFDETRAPSWYRSYRPQALGSASTLEAGPTYRATVTPESLQAAGKLPCATTMSSRRRRRHATAASSDFFCVPFGGRANGRVSTPPTPSATTAAPAPSAQTASTAPTAPTAARASRLLRPSAPRRATGLQTSIATTAAPARSSARPRADGTWTGPSSQSHHWYKGDSVCTCHCT